MKTKLLLTTAFILSISTSMFSQHRRGSQVRFKDSGKSDKEIMKENYARNDNPERVIELGYTYNYQFGGKTYAYTGNGRYTELKVNDSDSHAFSLSIPAKWNTRLELAFFNQSTQVYGDYSFGSEDVDMRYYQIGVLKEMPKGNLIPYGAFSLGALEVDPTNGDSVWKFAITLGGGLKYYFTKNIGLKLEARMMAPIAYGGIYLGTGGSGASVNSVTLQGYIGGGVTFALTR